MKKLTIVVFLLCVFTLGLTCAKGQLYEALAVYAISGTPTNGVKIKTNIPFVHAADMSTIFIRGFSYGGSNTINLQLAFYICSNASGPYFHTSTLSSSGSYTPRIFLANENGKVVLFIDDRVYYQRFWVDAFSTHSASGLLLRIRRRQAPVGSIYQYGGQCVDEDRSREISLLPARTAEACRTRGQAAGHRLRLYGRWEAKGHQPRQQSA